MDVMTVMADIATARTLWATSSDRIRAEDIVVRLNAKLMPRCLVEIDDRHRVHVFLFSAERSRCPLGVLHSADFVWVWDRCQLKIWKDRTDEFKHVQRAEMIG